MLKELIDKFISTIKGMFLLFVIFIIFQLIGFNFYIDFSLYKRVFFIFSSIFIVAVLVKNKLKIILWAKTTNRDLKNGLLKKFENSVIFDKISKRNHKAIVFLFLVTSPVLFLLFLLKNRNLRNALLIILLIVLFNNNLSSETLPLDFEILSVIIIIIYCVFLLFLLKAKPFSSVIIAIIIFCFTPSRIINSDNIMAEKLCFWVFVLVCISVFHQLVIFLKKPGSFSDHN
jgi:hypothetical protein